jgi:hypothetical protein
LPRNFDPSRSKRALKRDTEQNFKAALSSGQPFIFVKHVSNYGFQLVYQFALGFSLDKEPNAKKASKWRVQTSDWRPVKSGAKGKSKT